MLLSSLLGPVKPPVASREDLDASAGLYRIVARHADGTLQARMAGEAGGAPPKLVLAGGERCLVCLCEYDVDEQVRQLGKCSHLFHQECIDTVSRPDRHRSRNRSRVEIVANSCCSGF